MNGVLIVTAIAFLISILLVLLDTFLKKEDSRVKELQMHLPGYNCGACGFGSCEGMAKAILENPNNFQLCKPMKKDKKEEFERYLKEHGLLK